MGERFKKLKKQILISAIIKSAVCGVSSGLFVTGIILLALKLAKVVINPAFYVLICVVCAAACGVAVFFFLRPDDKKIARQIDEEYGLNERVQTMIEFSSHEGDIAALQREDAELKLNGLPKRKITLSKLWQYIVIPVVALALLFTAIFIPAGKPDENDPPFELTNVQAIALQQLIDDVKKSDLDETLKDRTVVVLEGLKDGLDETVAESVMRRTVIAAVSLIDGIFENANSYLRISSELSKYERSEKFGSSIVNAVVSYKSVTKITTLQKVNENAAKGDDDITEALTVATDDLKEGLASLVGINLSNEIQQFLTSFNASLVNSGYDDTDTLYKALDDFAGSLMTVSDRIIAGGYTTAALQNQISQACDTMVRSSTVVLATQMYNCMMDEFVREKLAEIFGIKSSDLPSQSTVVPSVPGIDTPPEDKDPDDETHGGGYGEGGVHYGSNDIIYYPDREEHLEYGEVFNEYYAEAEERLLSGEISDELIKFISEYFKSLDLSKRTEN